MISYMNKKVYNLLVFVIVSFVCNNVYAQETYYYKLVRAIENGNNTTDVSGGQFITFTSSICYESDINGKSVGHGQLVRNTNSEFHKYVGDSYWGRAEYLFSSDKSILNVISSGNKYVYKRSKAPNGVHTCSLIKRSKTTPKMSVRGNSYSSPVAPINNTSVSNNSGANENHINGHKCRVCNGTGEIISETWYGSAPDKWCDRCKKYVYPSHTHKRCDTCGGTGWISN